MHKDYNFNKSVLRYALYIIPFIWLEYIELIMPKISVVVDVIKGIIMFFLFLYMLKEKKHNKLILLIGVYFAFMVGVTYFRHYNIKSVVNTGLNTLFFCILTDFLMKKNVESTLTAMSLVFQLLVYINLFTMLVFPNGIYSTNAHPINWFLGYKNAHILYVLPALFFITINYIRKRKKINLYYLIFVILSGISIFLGKSSTGIIGYLIFVVGCFLIFINKNKIITIKKILLLNIILFFSVVIFQIQNLFALLIQNFFHKNLNFTGRTNIWSTTIKFIQKKPLIGYGVQPSSIRVLMYNNINAVNSHNEFLEILYNGGIILGSLFFCMVYLLMKKLEKNKNNNIAKLGTILLFVYFVMMLMESYRYSLFMYLFIVLYNVDLIIGKKE